MTNTNSTLTATATATNTADWNTLGWLVVEGLGAEGIMPCRRAEACTVPVGHSNSDGWRAVFSGDAVHAPSVAREHGCEGVVSLVPKTQGCAELILFRHDDGESAAYFVER